MRRHAIVPDVITCCAVVGLLLSRPGILYERCGDCPPCSRRYALSPGGHSRVTSVPQSGAGSRFSTAPQSGDALRLTPVPQSGDGGRLAALRLTPVPQSGGGGRLAGGSDRLVGVSRACPQSGARLRDTTVPQFGAGSRTVPQSGDERRLTPVPQFGDGGRLARGTGPHFGAGTRRVHTTVPQSGDARRLTPVPQSGGGGRLACGTVPPSGAGSRRAFPRRRFGRELGGQAVRGRAGLNINKILKLILERLHVGLRDPCSPWITPRTRQRVR